MTLQEIGLKNGTDKSTYHNFMEFYDEKFKELRYEKINILEIGFLNGSSVMTWLEYFENAKVYCLDIIDIDFKHDRFVYNKISQDNPILSNVFEDDFFTIIIDDGSHMTSHQQKSLELLWSKLKNNGFYVIEDLHTSFRPSYIDTEVTTFDYLINKKQINNLELFKKEFKNLEIFSKNENDYTDSVTSIITKEKIFNIKEIISDRKIIDCFIFYNELEMLEFRMEELNDVVDRFVIVESTKTFMRKEKELIFQKNLERYSKFLDKITHVIVDDLDDIDPWKNEHKQRNAIHKGISDLNLNPEDIIIVTDVDEIPDVTTIKEIKNNGLSNSVHILGQDMYYYNIKCKYNGRWHFPKICNFLTYSKINSPQTIRFAHGPVIEKGGWHFSYFGDTEFIKNKIKNFSHQEYNNDEFVNDEHIESVINSGKDLFKRENQNITYTIIEPEDNTYLPKNYKMLIH